MYKQYKLGKSHPKSAVERARTRRPIDRFAVVDARVFEWGGVFMSHDPSTRGVSLSAFVAFVAWRRLAARRVRMRTRHVSAPRGARTRRRRRAHAEGSVSSSRARTIYFNPDAVAVAVAFRSIPDRTLFPPRFSRENERGLERANERCVDRDGTRDALRRRLR